MTVMIPRMARKLLVLLLSLSVMLLTGVPGRAQPTANTNRWTAISDARMRSLLQGIGVDFTETASDDSTVFTFPINGHTVTLLNRVQSMLLSVCFAGQSDLLQANQWNREHYFTAIRPDHDGCAALQSNVVFSGGVTNEMMEGFIRGFCTHVTMYAKFVADPPPDPEKPPAAPGDGVQQTDHSASPIGTMAWTQLGQPGKDAAPVRITAQSASGLVKIQRNISLKYDPGQWKERSSESQGKFALSHSSGDGHALIIAEDTNVPLDVIVDIALANAQSADPSAKVVFRDKRRLNGVPVYFLKIEAEVDTVPLVYWGYFYAGETGTVQVVTYAPKTRWREHEKDFMEFLNGLAISK
jgi:hypothetical protein